MLKLYTYQACPYCVKVRKAFAEMNIEYVEIKAERGESGREKLEELGGKIQVPFLVDDEREVMMYESDDIIEYAREHYVS